MAASPKYKVYSRLGDYLAAFKYASDALTFVDAVRGSDPGCTIRLGHSQRLTLWTEGKEDARALDSHAEAVALVLRREDHIIGGQA